MPSLRFVRYIRSAAIRRSIHIISTAVPAALSLPGSISVMPMLLAMPIRPVPKNFPKHCRILRHELKILVIKTKSKSGRCRTLSGFLCRQQSEKRPLHRRSSVAELCGQRAAGSSESEKSVADLNEANLKMAKHEQTHASNGQYMKAVNTGDILLSPGGIYLARMADELRAQIKGGNIQATAAGVENFLLISEPDITNSIRRIFSKTFLIIGCLPMP